MADQDRPSFLKDIFQTRYREVTISAVVFAILIGVIMNAAITYAGLKIGFTLGGSAIAAPTGNWVVEPVAGHEGLITADLDRALLDGERQNFDPAGHYARPDVFDVRVDRRRREAATFLE